AFTSVCTDQMRSLERNFERLKDAGIDVVLGVSVDAQPSKAVWAKAISVEDTLILADFEPKGEMSKAYGVYNEKRGISGRANIIVDEAGFISFAKEYKLSELPDIEEIIQNA
ncbi:MAG TPA: redoxin domain-containing protein, partial [Oscillospiraceae bacterium]|nr:redoxin domain-containing protein [Oscillospiraceae bacterium]